MIRFSAGRSVPRLPELLRRAALAQGMSSEQCGTCHESQYNTWKQGKHNMKLGPCNACHGEFHSGSLKGCTGCHSTSHKVHYKNWEFVKDYVVEGDTSDYYCISLP